MSSVRTAGVSQGDRCFVLNTRWTSRFESDCGPPTILSRPFRTLVMTFGPSSQAVGLGYNVSALWADGFDSAVSSSAFPIHPVIVAAVAEPNYHEFRWLGAGMGHP
jgi:hypothetical protein